MKDIHSHPEYSDLGGGCVFHLSGKPDYVQCSDVHYPVHYPAPYVAAPWAITNVLLFQLTSASAQEDKDIQLDHSSQSQHAGAG